MPYHTKLRSTSSWIVNIPRCPCPFFKTRPEDCRKPWLHCDLGMAIRIGTRIKRAVKHQRKNLQTKEEVKIQPGNMKVINQNWTLHNYIINCITFAWTLYAPRMLLPPFVMLWTKWFLRSILQMKNIEFLRMPKHLFLPMFTARMQPPTLDNANWVPGI